MGEKNVPTENVTRVVAWTVNVLDADDDEQDEVDVGGVNLAKLQPDRVSQEDQIGIHLDPLLI